MTAVRIATRRSPLALAQAAIVAERLRTANGEVETMLVEVTTTGDVDRSSPVAALTEVGAFVRAVQMAVLEGDADVAVHSAKDLPVAGLDGLASFYPERQRPWDVLCGATLDDLPTGARVGTGSPRRAAQLSMLRPDLVVEGIRGNVDTRLRAIGTHVDAVVLAEAGLRRIGREGDIAERFTSDRMVPAAGQGTICIEAIEGSPTADLVRSIDDAPTRATVEAERAVLARTGAGCRSALGVHATTRTGALSMTGFVADDEGPRRAVSSSNDPTMAVDDLITGLGL